MNRLSFSALSYLSLSLLSLFLFFFFRRSLHVLYLAPFGRNLRTQVIYCFCYFFFFKKEFCSSVGCVLLLLLLPLVLSPPPHFKFIWFQCEIFVHSHTDLPFCFLFLWFHIFGLFHRGKCPPNRSAPVGTSKVPAEWTHRTEEASWLREGGR
jgi:hypothetical protein